MYREDSYSPIKFIIWSDCMGLITKTTKVKWHGSTKQHYINLGYVFTKINDEFEVKVEDLTIGSKAKVSCECDNCHEINNNIDYKTYVSHKKEDNSYYCNKCSKLIFGTEKYKNTLIQQGHSFYNWFVKNGLNIKHYWDYEKNGDLDPKEINYGSKITIWIFCQENIEHGSYKTTPNGFTKGNRCPKCVNFKGENSPCWNPNITQEEREKGRFIEGYKDFIKEVFKRDNYTCQCCNKHGGNLNAHHLNGYNWDKEHRTDVDNGITLCEECHREFHKIYGMGNNTKEQFEEWINKKK